MLPPLTTPSPETLAYALALSDEEQTYQRDIQRAREYDSGQQFVRLTDRLRQFLGDDTSADHDLLRLNVCKTVVTAVVERLIVTGFDTNEQGKTKPLAKQAWDWWTANRMDVYQDDAHAPCVRDASAFVLVEWDADKGVPAWHPHPRYVDPVVGGDGYGCRMFYRNDDPRQGALFATKRWSEVWYTATGVRQTRQRVTYYYPDRIEKYVDTLGVLERVKDKPDEPHPIPWVGRVGKPLGIAVVPFLNAGGVDGHGGIEAWEAMPLQNAINKELIDLLASSDASAFRILIALGFEPKDKDGKPLAVAPGTWIGTTRTKNEASVSTVEPVDLSGLLAVIDSLILKVAQVTDTPASRFVTTKQVAAEGTLKQQEAPLVAKLKKRQTRFGDSWEQVIALSVRLANVYASANLDEEVRFSCQWESAETRDEAAEYQRADMLERWGVPLSEVALLLGFSQEQAQRWQAAKDERAMQMQAQLQASNVPTDQQTDQPKDATRNATTNPPM